MLYNVNRRAVAMLLILCMVFTQLPVNTFAAEGECSYGYNDNCVYTSNQEGLPSKHESEEHDDSCSLAEGIEGSSCTHDHDADWGGPEYIGEEPEIECTCGAEADEEGTVNHDKDCPLYVPPETPVVVFEACDETHETADCPYYIDPTISPDPEEEISGDGLMLTGVIQSNQGFMPMAATGHTHTIALTSTGSFTKDSIGGSNRYLLTTGNYYLNNDISDNNNNARLTIYNGNEVEICLNGHDLKLTNIVVMPGATLNIVDCTGNGRIISNYNNYLYGTICNHGNLNLENVTVISTHNGNAAVVNLPHPGGVAGVTPVVPVFTANNCTLESTESKALCNTIEGSGVKGAQASVSDCTLIGAGTAAYNNAGRQSGSNCKLLISGGTIKTTSQYGGCGINNDCYAKLEIANNIVFDLGSSGSGYNIQLGKPCEIKVTRLSGYGPGDIIIYLDGYYNGDLVISDVKEGQKDWFKAHPNSNYILSYENGEIYRRALPEVLPPLDDKVTSLVSGKTYTIANEDQLRRLSSLVNEGKGSSGCTFLLIGDIVLTEGSFTPIGFCNYSEYPFKGTFDGQGHKISGLYVNSTYVAAGLFGRCDGAAIRNLTVGGSVNNTHTYYYAGGISGHIKNTTIEKCASHVAVKGNGSCTGGIVGLAETGSKVKNCYVTGDVTASSYEGDIGGGIAGKVDGSGVVVQNCYATGKVKGNIIGGIAGKTENGASIKDCLAFNTRLTRLGDSPVAGRISGIAPAMENNAARKDMLIGGKEVSGGTATNLNGADIILSDATKQSSVFAGWDTSIWHIEGDTALKADAPLPALVSAKDQTADLLPAVEYIVTYDRNYTGGGSSQGTVKLGEAYNNQPNESRIGYIFGGWFTEKTGGTQVIVGETVYTSESPSDHILYAKWSLQVFPLISKHPTEKVTVKRGEIDRSLSITMTTTEYTYTYQWQQKNSEDTWGNVACEKSTFSIPKDLVLGEYIYRCVVTAWKDGVEMGFANSRSSEVTVIQGCMPANLEVVLYNGTYDGKEHPAFTINNAPEGYTVRSGLSSDNLQDGILTVKHIVTNKVVYYEISHPDYSSFSGNGKYMISPKEIEIDTMPVVKDKLYDGTKIAEVESPGTLKDLVEGEELELTCTASFNSTGNVGDAGNDIFVSVKFSIADKTVNGVTYYASDYNLKSDNGFVRANILPRPYSDDDICFHIKSFPDVIYNGYWHVPSTTVIFNDVTLKSGLDFDYSVSYFSNLNVGTASVTIYFRKNFSGSATKTFKIKPKPIEASAVTIKAKDVGYECSTEAPWIISPAYPYTGSEIKPKLTVGIEEATLVENIDYSLIYKNNISGGGTGEITITLTPTCNYAYADSSEKVKVQFPIGFGALPEGITNDNIFTMTTTKLMEWHKEDITLFTKESWKVSTDGSAWDTSVILGDESTKDTEGKIVPGNASLFVKDSEGRIYKTDVKYMLDKTAPVITVEGMGADGVNKIWDREKTIIIRITDELSDMRYVIIMGEDSIDFAEYGQPEYGYNPIPDDGNYTYVVKANDIYTITVYDNADNQTMWDGELPTFVVEKIDSEKPVAAFASFIGTQGINGWYTGDINVFVNIYDPETIPDDPSTLAINESNKSGISKWEYSIDGGDTWIEKSPADKSFTIDAGGDYTELLKLRSRDNAGNISDVAVASAKLDKSKPKPPIITATVEGESYNGDFTVNPVNLTAAVNGTAVSGLSLQYKIGDGSWTDGSAAIHGKNTGDSGVTYYFRAVSGAGTQSEEESIVVKYRALDKDTVLDGEDNKYTNDNIKANGESIKDGWYTEDVTLTVIKKEEITDGNASYQAETWYKLDDDTAIKLEGDTINIDGDGIHTLEIWTKDAAGNETTHLTIVIKIDKTPPVILEITGSPTNWQNTDATISITASDATSQIESIEVKDAEGKLYIVNNDKTFVADKNGIYTITVIDKAGNITSETVKVKRIDKSIPVKPQVSGYTGDTWEKEDITFKLSTTDTADTVPSGITYQVKIGNGDWTGIEGDTYKITEDTDNTIYSFRSVSGAGTYGEAVAFTVKLDKTIPHLTPTVTAGGLLYDGSSFTGNDIDIVLNNSKSNISGTTYYYQQVVSAGDDWEPVNGEDKWEPLDGNSYKVDYNCNAYIAFKGLSGADIWSAEIVIPVKRSVLSNEELSQTQYGKDDFTINKSSNENGWYNSIPTVTAEPKDTVGIGGLTATTYYELYKEPDESGIVTVLNEDDPTITPESDGIWTLKLWTEDIAGNKTEPYIITLRVDTKEPTIEVTGNTDTWQKTDVILTVEAFDEISGLSEAAYSFDGGETWQKLNNKTYGENTEVNIWVKDKAGNINNRTTIIINRIDKIPPVVSWNDASLALKSEKWYGRTAITAIATDNSGEVLSPIITTGGKQYENGTVFDAVGTHTFTAFAMDPAGNTGYIAETITVRIDTAIDDFIAMVEVLNADSGYEELLGSKGWYDNQSNTIRDRLSKNEEAKEAYEWLLTLIKDKAQEAAEGLKDSIQNADTLDKIREAVKNYNSLPDEAKGEISETIKKQLEQKKKDADAAQIVINQLKNANRDKVEEGDKIKDPGGSYDEKQAAKEAYEKLTNAQKELVSKEPGAINDKDHIITDLDAINYVLKQLRDIKKPYTPITKDKITAVKNTYDALNQKQKDAFPKDEKSWLDTLEGMFLKAQIVEDKIKALGETPDLTALNTVKAAYNALTADEKSMVDSALKTELDKKYQSMLAQLEAEDKSAFLFAAKVEEAKNSPTIEKIEELIKNHNVLSQEAKTKLSDETKADYDKLCNDLSKAKGVIEKLDKIYIDKLLPEDLGDILDALGMGSSEGYDDLTRDQQELVDDATKGKAGILDKAIKDITETTAKIEFIPEHGEDSTNPDGTPDLDDCENLSNSSTGNVSLGGHTHEDHRKAIEDAKIAFEKLSDTARRLMSDEAKEKLSRQYSALIAYLEYKNQIREEGSDRLLIEVSGMAENLDLSGSDITTSAKTVVVVRLTPDSRPAEMPSTPSGKQEMQSVDIKLEALIFDDPDADVEKDEPISTEIVQPDFKNGKTVLVKLLLPTGYKTDTLEIWHIKESGIRRRIRDFWLITEGNNNYAVFEIDSFSHFIFFAEKISDGNKGDKDTSERKGSGTAVKAAEAPVITDTDNGTVTITPMKPYQGSNVIINPKPDEGYIVDEIIVIDQEGGNVLVKDNGDGAYWYIQPSGKVTITVTFKITPKDSELPFTDVKNSDWFYESVKFVYENGLMIGMTDKTFNPNVNMVRGMIVTILWRLEGKPDTKTIIHFADVPADMYYTNAVAWGIKTGIVKGYDNGKFGPDDPITREQLAAILYRYAGYKGINTTNSCDLSSFFEQPSDWAMKAMQWAVREGIIKGKGNGILDPKGVAARVEAAVILERFMKNRYK